MPVLSIREYNSESGALLSNVNVLSWGKITAGTRSRVKVIDIAFSEVTEVSNIKLGLISSGGLNVASNVADTGNNADGSANFGHFGIESTASFDSSKASAPLIRFFKGINATITAADTNNVSINSRSATLSNYIYLDIETDASSIGANTGAYKVFFDFS